MFVVLLMIFRNSPGVPPEILLVPLQRGQTHTYEIPKLFPEADYWSRYRLPLVF